MIQSFRYHSTVSWIIQDTVTVMRMPVIEKFKFKFKFKFKTPTPITGGEFRFRLRVRVTVTVHCQPEWPGQPEGSS